MPAANANRHLVRDETTSLIKRCVRLRDHDLLFTIGRQIVDDVGSEGLDANRLDAGVLDLLNSSAGKFSSGCDDHFSSFGVDNVISQELALQWDGRVVNYELRNHAPVRSF